MWPFRSSSRPQPIDQFRDDDDWRRFHREAQVEMGLVAETEMERCARLARQFRQEREQKQRDLCKDFGLEYFPGMNMFDVYNLSRNKGRREYP